MTTVLQTSARYRFEDLRDFAEAVFRHEGLSQEHAAIAGGAICDAELHGIGPHGMPHLLLNVQKLRDGEAAVSPEIVVDRRGASVFRLDGGGCLGAIAANRSAGLASETALETGVGLCLATNTHTFGAAAHFLRPLVEQHLVGLIWANTAPLMAPAGSIKPLLGTNPIGIGIPAPGDPFILDMACSVRSWGDIVEADREGRSIPEGWAIDPEGNATADPAAALAGAMLPFGGYKGAGFALAVELLTGYLAGHGLTEPIPQTPGFARTPLRSHCVLVVDVKRFVPVAEFEKNVRAFFEQLARSGKAGEMPPRYPGQGAAERRRRREAEGIPLHEALVARLRVLADETGVEWPRAIGDRS